MLNTLIESDGAVYVGGSFKNWVAAAPSNLLMYDTVSGLRRRDFPERAWSG
jgi:hypothetical protein